MQLTWALGIILAGSSLLYSGLKGGDYIHKPWAPILGFLGGKNTINPNAAPGGTTPGTGFPPSPCEAFIPPFNTICKGILPKL